MKRTLARMALTTGGIMIAVSACVATMPDPPVPPPTSDGIRRDGICGRTPEVQSAIIRALGRDGPALPCRDIDAQEMRRLRELAIDTPYLVPGDLEGLSGLQRLEARIVESWPTAGSMEGMPQLEELKLIIGGSPRDWRVESGTFRGLKGLRTLEIAGEPGRRPRAGIHLETGSLRGLDGVRQLRIDGVESIEPATLHGLGQLQHAWLRASFRTNADRHTAPAMPPEVRSRLAGLQRGEARGFREREW